MLPIKILITATIVTSWMNSSHAVLHHNDDSKVVLDEDGCPPFYGGPYCESPYELCLDGKRRCYNNSKCKLMITKDPTNEYQYECDCSFAESVDKVAGMECENSATIYCGKGEEEFCTNGGACGAYVLKGHHYKGCHCKEEFSGAHCQYLKAELKTGLEGEALVPEIGDDFYVKTDTVKPLYSIGALTILACISVSIASFVYLYSYYKQGKHIKELSADLRHIRSASAVVSDNEVV
mmetsp:Transcript_4256/g.5527  ORF Transcript_4256/g.5527 Transcript_4256/m.5527 type:complete len:236 (-) Transcript_4256:276-983(-)